MGRLLLRVLGVLLGGYALLAAASAAMFRMDGAGELEQVLQVDVVVGGALAAAVTLVRVPAAGAGTVRWHGLTFLSAALVWAAVSGGLAWSHLELYRIRSTPPVLIGK